MKVGQRFGRLVVLGFGDRDKHGQKALRCLCDCGKETHAHSSNLCSGRSKSCGCLNRELSSSRSIKHGHSQTRTKCASGMYRIWAGMLQRCRNKEHGAYSLYGGRGIKVCKRWEEFASFLSDMGERPIGMSLDRIDNDGDYAPSNCQWATRKQQARNTRRTRMVTIGSQTKALRDWADHYGIKSCTLSARLYGAGWTAERALTTPVRRYGR